MTCDPCQFCLNIYDDSDPSVGSYGCGCRAADAGHEDIFDTVMPCPHFRPRLVSDDLLEQIRNEEEAEFWAELGNPEVPWDYTGHFDKEE